MNGHSLDVLINCAAYTNVPKAEERVEDALRVNETGAAKLAEYCKDRDALFIHISTDYVFDGKQQSAYTEMDEPNPLNKYGYSKWRGEHRVADTGCAYLTLRVSWLVSRYEGNFLTFMLKKMKMGQDLKVVDDQFASPTSAAHRRNLLVWLCQTHTTNS